MKQSRDIQRERETSKYKRRVAEERQRASLLKNANKLVVPRMCVRAHVGDAFLSLISFFWSLVTYAFVAVIRLVCTPCFFPSYSYFSAKYVRKVLDLFEIWQESLNNRTYFHF